MENLTPLINADNPKLRALYLGFDVTYINRTREQFVEVLKDAFDLLIFGPGYVTGDELDRGLNAFYHEYGPFDVIFGDEYSLLHPGMVSEDRKHEHSFYYQACRFDPLLIHKGTEYYSFLKGYRGVRIIMLLAYDYYGFSEADEAMLNEVADYYVCWGQEFLQEKCSVTDETLADMALNRQIYERWTDRYLNFVSHHSDRILSTPHFVGPSEGNQKPIAQRQSKWSVVGADYDSRVLARSLLDENNLSRTGKSIPYIYAAANRLGFHLYNKYWAIKFLNWIFLKAMSDARYGFTCGSILRWPIRKYFEIPVSGAILVAEKCNGWSELGFESGVNAIECEARDVLDAHDWLESDLDRSQSIATAGYQLVDGTHSIAARSRQIAKSVGLIITGSFRGSFWRNGDLCFHGSDDSSSIKNDYANTVS